MVLVDKITELATKKGCTPSQLAIAWLMAQGEEIFPIPGTRRLTYLEENIAAVHVDVSPQEEAEIRKWIGDIGVAGDKMGKLIEDYGDTPSL